jgi:hypothetical protein
MSPGEQIIAGAQLRAFVTWLIDRYELTVEERMPRCWAMHPGLVEELWALRAWRQEVYGGTMPSAGQAARYWHAELDRVLHAATSRYAAGCRAGHRSAPGFVSTDNRVQKQWSEANMLAGIPPVDTAAGRAARRGNLISAEEMAAAFNAGAARFVPGLRDYVEYGGMTCVPASGGWLPVPPVADPGPCTSGPADGERPGGPHDRSEETGRWAR